MGRGLEGKGVVSEGLVRLKERVQAAGLKDWWSQVMATSGSSPNSCREDLTSPRSCYAGRCQQCHQGS